MDLDIDGYIDLMHDSMCETAKNPVWTKVTKKKIGEMNGLFAELDGTIDDTKIHYYFYIVESEEYFHQVIGWTLQSKKDENREVITKVMDSLKILETESE